MIGGPRNVLPMGAVPRCVSWDRVVGAAAGGGGFNTGMLGYQDFRLGSWFSWPGSLQWAHYGGIGAVSTIPLDVSPTNGISTVSTNGFQDTSSGYNGSTDFSSFPSGVSLPTGASSRSFAAWLQVPNFTNFFVFLNYGTLSSTEELALYVDETADISAGTIVLDVGAATRVHSSTAINAGWPQHVVVTTAGAFSTTKFYINGSLTGTTLTGADQTLNTVSGTQVFIEKINTTIYGPGQLFDFRAFNTILGPADVLDLYAAGLANRNSFWTQQNEMPVLKSTATFQSKWPPFQLRAA